MQTLFRSFVLCSAVLAATPAPAAQAEPSIILEVTTPPRRGEISSAIPPRFVLFEDGEVFVGGTSEVAAGRLEKAQVQAIEDRIALVRKLPGLANTVELGPGGDAYRLRLTKARLEILAKGDLSAPSPLSTLLRDLASFHHPTLRRYVPPAYLLVAHERRLAGGLQDVVILRPPFLRPRRGADGTRIGRVGLAHGRHARLGVRG